MQSLFLIYQESSKVIILPHYYSYLLIKHVNWSAMPDLKYFPSECEGLLSTCSTRKGSPLHHNATTPPLFSYPKQIWSPAPSLLKNLSLNLDSKSTLAAPTHQILNAKQKQCTSLSILNLQKKQKKNWSQEAMSSLEINLLNLQIDSNTLALTSHKISQMALISMKGYLAASKNCNALGKELFRYRKISLHIRFRLYIATSIYILL